MFKPHPKQVEFFESEERYVLWDGAYPSRSVRYWRIVMSEIDMSNKPDKPDDKKPVDKGCSSNKKILGRGDIAYLNLLKIRMDADKTFTAAKLNEELDAQWKEAQAANEAKKEKK